MLPFQVGETTLSKSKFLFEIERKKEQILKTTFESYFSCKIGVNFRYQYTRSSTNIKYRYRCKLDASS